MLSLLCQPCSVTLTLVLIYIYFFYVVPMAGKSEAKEYLTIIPRARMGYESIAHEAEELF